jgi:hemoglobin
VDTVFDRLGGQAYFDGLVERFYEGVASDPVLRPLYPENLDEPRRHLALFLGQYWGGPAAYNEERGHPRLRMRHVPFVIGLTERNAWLAHMTAAVESSGAPAEIQAELIEYFDMASRSLINAVPPPSNRIPIT